MADFNGISDLADQVNALEVALDGAQGMTAAFTGELTDMQASIADLSTDVNQLSRGISSGLRKAFDGLIFDGMKLSDALRTVAQSTVDAAYNAALRPVTNHFGGLLGSLVGGLMNGVTPFASGGVVSSATAFPMRGGLGLMGEAGPEAIMPLARGPDGRLGVRGGGGRPVNITMNISTPDVEGFRRSQGQIATQMARAIARGQRNM
ncbi:MAG TPA: phage tail tape measure protein [Aliiroseovarius sp.]|nr:phage tail tape measure protein [Aliiroseovarius sp.]